MCEIPGGWPHSSYPGYAGKIKELDFVQYDTLYAAWAGECGGNAPAVAYRRFVAEGLRGVVENPLKAALSEWVIGSEDFLKRMVALAEKQNAPQPQRLARRTKAFTIDEIMDAVAEASGVKATEYVGFRSGAAGRDVAAPVCRRLTGCTLAELSTAFGLGHPDSSANLVRRAKTRESKRARFRQQVKNLEAQLLSKPENQV